MERADSNERAAGAGADRRSGADHGLSGYDVLRKLALARDVQLRLSELADAVLLGRAGLGGLVTRLESTASIRY